MRIGDAAKLLILAGLSESLNCGNKQLVYTFGALDSCLKDSGRSPTTLSLLL
jgi:hypothetical protein